MSAQFQQHCQAENGHEGTDELFLIFFLSVLLELSPYGPSDRLRFLGISSDFNKIPKRRRLRHCQLELGPRADFAVRGSWRCREKYLARTGSTHLPTTRKSSER